MEPSDSDDTHPGGKGMEGRGGSERGKTAEKEERGMGGSGRRNGEKAEREQEGKDMEGKMERDRTGEREYKKK